MTVYTVIGLAGFAGYLASYGALQLGMLDGNGVVYTLANVVAAALVLASMLEQFNLASALIQISWIGFGVIGLALRLGRSGKVRAGTTPGQAGPAEDSGGSGILAYDHGGG